MSVGEGSPLGAANGTREAVLGRGGHVDAAAALPAPAPPLPAESIGVSEGGPGGIGGAGGGRWLSVAEVGALLGAMELPQYAAAFREASIDGSMVEDLGALWDDLGVRHAAHRLKIAKRLGWAVRAVLEGPAAGGSAGGQALAPGSGQATAR